MIFRRKLVGDQKFFVVPPTSQIELHEACEDKTESAVVFNSSQRPSAATVVGGSTDMKESEEQATQAGVLGILRNRKARIVQDDNEDYPEHMELTGE